MTHWIEIAPPHSLVLVVGSKNADIPPSLHGALIAATSSCIAIGCKAEDDGLSRLALESADITYFDIEPAFVTQLETPEGVVAIETVFGERVAEHPTPSSTTRIIIWVNDDMEPDEILIAFGG